jgi:hypothetical protein
VWRWIPPWFEERKGEWTVQVVERERGWYQVRARRLGCRYWSYGDVYASWYLDTLELGELEVLAMSFLQRVQAPTDAAGVVNVKDPDWEKSYPALWEHMTTNEWPDTKGARDTSTVTIFVDRDSVSACCSDRATDRTCWAQGATVKEALRALEKRVAEGGTNWRAKPRKEGRKR